LIQAWAAESKGRGSYSAPLFIIHQQSKVSKIMKLTKIMDQ
jgi:hypothetical protein